MVLDTEGVNAFAAPGGFVHITKGLLGLMKNEAELAGVLAHEIIHVTEKHTVNAIQQGDVIRPGIRLEVGAAGGMTQSLIADFAQKAYSNILNNKFSRNDEVEADDKGVQLANKVGYAPSGPRGRADEAHRPEQGCQGAERSVRLASDDEGSPRQPRQDDSREEADGDGNGSGALRQEHHLRCQARRRPGDGCRRLARPRRWWRGEEGRTRSQPTDAEEEGREPKKSGGMLSKFKPSSGSQAQQSQTVASAGARGVNPDRDAVGGPNKKRVPVKIGPNDIAEFQKGIA